MRVETCYASQARSGTFPRALLMLSGPEEPFCQPGRQNLRVDGHDSSSEIPLKSEDFCCYCCDPSNHLAGVSAPSGPKIAKKSQKESLQGSAKKVPKTPRTSKNTPQNPILGILLLFALFPGTFLQTPEKTLFNTFLRFWARRARRLL